MVAVVASDESLLIRFDSDIAFVDYAVDIIDDLLSYRGFRERTNVLIVCRELLKNAVVHGNRNDARKPVTLRLQRLSGGQYRVESDDGGGGFDTPSLERKEETGERPEHRTGFALIGALAGRILFNDRGNRITVFMEPEESVAR